MLIDVSTADIEKAAENEVKRIVDIIAKETPKGMMSQTYIDLIKSVTRTAFIFGATWMRLEMTR